MSVVRFECVELVTEIPAPMFGGSRSRVGTVRWDGSCVSAAEGKREVRRELSFQPLRARDAMMNNMMRNTSPLKSLAVGTI